VTTTEEIVSSLDSAADGLDSAKTQTAAAIDHADGVRNKALAHGWTGIADGMQEAIDRLQEAQGAVGQATDAVDTAARPAREVNERTNPTEVRTHLGQAVEGIGRAASAISAATTGLDDAEGAVSRALDGGDPSHLLGLIDEARQHLTTAHQAVEQAKTQAEAEIQEAAQAGN
jgi:uncharacterized phage infection (PIP) family protein YhgE